MSNLSATREGVLDVEGARLRYVIVGRGASLIVLHGGPGLGCDYLREELTELLADCCRLVFYDQRGSGRSTGAEVPERLTMAQFVKDLDAVIRLAGSERVHLLGHSFGGLLALHHAVAHPGGAASLVLVDPDPARWEDWARSREVVAARRSVREARELRRIEAAVGWRLDPRAVARHLRTSLRPYCFDAEDAERLRLDCDRALARNLAVTGERIRADLERYDLLPALPSVDVPVLLVTGEASIYPLDVFERMHARLPRSRLIVLERAGHFPQTEEPQRFARAVRGFLAEIA